MGTRGVGHTPPTAVGSHQLGNWGMVRYASRSASSNPPPPLCKIDFTTQGWGFTYIYAEGAPPTRGLIYATTDLAKLPTQGTTFTFPTHQSRRSSALAPIVNGLSTDVKFFAARFSVYHPVAAPRCFVLHSAVAGIWNGITRDAVRSNSIRFNSVSYTKIQTATVFVASFLNTGSSLFLQFVLHSSTPARSHQAIVLEWHSL